MSKPPLRRAGGLLTDNVVYLDERFRPAPVVRLRAKAGPDHASSTCPEAVTSGEYPQGESAAECGMALSRLAGARTSLDDLMREWRRLTVEIMTHQEPKDAA